jgi:Domain of unknown function (DUF5666)/Viral BACON domain/Putative binding domain, N-terminal
MANESGRERTVTVLLGFALMVAGCGGTELSQTTGPTPVKCQTALTGMPSSLGASGARLNATLTTTRECAWTASSDVPWVTVKPATGQGGSSLSVVVAENTVAASRSGAILVNDRLVRFTQQAAPCRFALDSSSARVGSQGGPVAVSVSATAGCTWTASTEAAWVRTLTTRGTGSGTAEFSVQPNNGAERRATLTVAGLTVTVMQASAAGADPTPPPAPDPDPPPTPPTSRVSFKGRVSTLSGVCPSLTFTADDRQVSTDAQTRFTHGKCDDMRNGIDVDIDGDVLASGVILASKVELKDNDDDDDDGEDDDDGGDDGR